MLNITSNTQTEWFFGISFNESAVATSSPNGPLAAQYAAQILGTHLKGLQIGNEPDLYTDRSTCSRWYRSNLHGAFPML
jgi:hypothetical protein